MPSSGIYTKATEPDTKPNTLRDTNYSSDYRAIAAATHADLDWCRHADAESDRDVDADRIWGPGSVWGSNGGALSERGKAAFLYAEDW
jgi:hypothetical protein